MRRGKRELKNETTIKGTASGGKNKKSKKVIVQINKIKNVNGYQIVYANNKNFKKASTVMTIKTNCTIKKLKKNGIKKVVMMTGDSERTAAAIAKRVGVDEYYSEVLPEDKANFITKETEKGRKVMMIGDGINDSPALSAASVGIAVSDGAEIAKEIADITISAESLYEVVALKKISNALLKRIHKNYRSIVGINSGLIVLGVAGVLAPATSALCHNVSTLLISLNSMKNLLPEE